MLLAETTMPELANSDEPELSQLLDDSELQEDSDNIFNPLHNLTERKKESLLSQFKGRLDASIKYMETLYPQMIDNFKKYRSIADPIVDSTGQEIKDEPNIFVPYPFGIVESELPRLAGKLPRIRIAARKPIDEKEIERRQDYLYYVFDRMKFLQIQTLWLRQFEIYGWSPLYYFWKFEESTVLVNKDGALRKEKAVKYDDFWAKVVDVFDSFLQPGSTGPDEGDWFIFRELVSRQDIKKLIDSEVFYPEVADYLEKGVGTSNHSDTGRDIRDELIGQKKENSPHAYGKYELYWCLEDDKIMCMLGEGNILCMVSDNPNPLQKKPILNCNLTELVSEAIGISTIESMAGLPDKLNALTNARLKNIALQLGKVFLVNKNAQVDWDNFVMDAGNLIFTNDIENTAKELEFSDNAISSEREVLTTKEETQFATGTSDYIVGVKSGARLTDTATGVSTIVREANARYSLKQASYESGCLRDLVIMADAYSKLYCTEEKNIYVLGPKGFKSSVITPEDLAWEADIMVEPGSVVPLDQATRRENLTQLLDRFMKMPGIVRMDKYTREVLRANDFQNADELIVEKPQGAGGIENDIQLATDENTSLSMGQPVPLLGNDNLHLAIHNQAAQDSNLTPDILSVVQDHIKQHSDRLAAMQEQAAASQIAMSMAGGPNATTQTPQQGANLPPGTGPVPASPAPVRAGGMEGAPGMAQGAGRGANLQG